MRSKLDLLTCESIITPEQAYCLGGIISLQQKTMWTMAAHAGSFLSFTIP